MVPPARRELAPPAPASVQWCLFGVISIAACVLLGATLARGLYDTGPWPVIVLSAQIAVVSGLVVFTRRSRRSAFGVLLLAAMVTLLGQVLLADVLAPGEPFCSIEGLDGSRRTGWWLAAADLAAAFCAAMGARRLRWVGAGPLPMLVTCWLVARAAERAAVQGLVLSDFAADPDATTALAAACLATDAAVALGACWCLHRWLPSGGRTRRFRLRGLAAMVPALVILVGTGAPHESLAGQPHRSAAREIDRLTSRGFAPWRSPHGTRELRGAFLALTEGQQPVAVGLDGARMLRPESAWAPAPNGCVHVLIPSITTTVAELQAALARVRPSNVYVASVTEHRRSSFLDARLPIAADHRFAVTVHQVLRGDRLPHPNPCFRLDAADANANLAGLFEAGCGTGGAAYDERRFSSPLLPRPPESYFLGPSWASSWAMAFPALLVLFRFPWQRSRRAELQWLVPGFVAIVAVWLGALLA